MLSNSLRLDPVEIGWVSEKVNPPDDYCVHARVEFSVADVVLVSPSEGIWTVSASALFLLRSLTANHTEEFPVAEHNYLFPHCAMDAWPDDGKYGLVLAGCQNGVDVFIEHEPEGVTLVREEKRATVSNHEWSAAVLSFVEKVELFYLESKPKNELHDEFSRRGWRLFWEEWNTRKSGVKLGS
jgi:hypothetical protein